MTQDSNNQPVEVTNPTVAASNATNKPTRQPKTLSLSEAIEKFVPDGVESLAVGGLHLHNAPMALIRELIRQKKHIKRLVTSPAASIQADLLIGAGLVEEVVTSYLGFEYLGLAPAFRRLAQENRLKVYEIDEFSLLTGLKAGASGQPFVALPHGIELSDVSKSNPEFYKSVQDPFSQQTFLAVPAIRPKVALVLAQQADQFGNALFKGSLFADPEIIFAAEQVVLQVEQVIPTRQLTRTPTSVNIPAYAVSAVVQAPFSAHPTSSHRFYHYDEDHLKEYMQAARTAAGFEAYVQKYFAEGDENAYIGRTSIVEG